MQFTLYQNFILSLIILTDKLIIHGPAVFQTCVRQFTIKWLVVTEIIPQVLTEYYKCVPYTKIVTKAIYLLSDTGLNFTVPKIKIPEVPTIKVP